MARNDPQMNLRVPMELKEKIEKAALDNGRTITAEAVYRLEQSFFIEIMEHPSIAADIAEINQRIEKQELILEKLLQLGDKVKNLEK